MDPRSLINQIEKEVALHGPQGISQADLFDLIKPEVGVISPPLQSSLIATLEPKITLQNNVLLATEDLQYEHLTGQLKHNNAVGPKTFELLCAIARSRSMGLSTVQASKATNQDLRSLFGRIQTLLNLNLISKKPIIENGAHTNLILFHLFDQKPENQSLNKNAVASEIIDFLAKGQHGMQLQSKIYSELGGKMAIDDKKKRPTIRRILNDLLNNKVIERVQIQDPTDDSKTFTCVKLVQSTTNLPPVSFCGTHFTYIDNDVELDAEMQANQVLPLPNQIQSFVWSCGSLGTSIMDLNVRVFNGGYKKTLGKYLEILTLSEENNLNIEHLSLMKGVDFDKRVKFFRYFAKPFYMKVNCVDMRFGKFVGSSGFTFKSLGLQTFNFEPKLLGRCGIQQDLSPWFLGEELKGKLLVDSKPVTKKLGRPRKGEKVDKPQYHSIVEPSDLEFEGGVPFEGSGPSLMVSHRFEKQEVENIVAKPNQVSLAMAQRIDLVLKIVSLNNGVVQGGTALMDMYNASAPGDHKIDRRTMNNVLNKLVNDGQLEQIFFNVNTLSGGTQVRTLFIDPLKVPEREESFEVLEEKKRIIANEFKKRSMATKQALEQKSQYPMMEVTMEEFDLIKPNRMKNTTTQRQRNLQKKKTRFGPSAADVLGLDEFHMDQQVPKRRHTESTKVVEEETDMSRAQTLIDPHLTTPTVVNIDLERLGKVVVVSRSLFNEKMVNPINWKLVAECFPPHSQKKLKRAWSAAKRTLYKEGDGKQDVVYTRMQEFEDIFMLHLNRGTIEYPTGTNCEIVNQLVDWLYTVDFSELEVDHLTAKLELEPVNKSQNVVDPFLNLQIQSTISNAERMLASTVVGHSFTPKFCAGQQCPLNLTNAELKVRAMIAADEDTYDAQLAVLELGQLTNDEVENARSSLVTKRIIKWGAKDTDKVPHGRPYVLNDNVFSVLQSKVNAFNPQFTNPEFKIYPTVSDEEVMQLIEHASNGNLNLIRKNERIGMISSAYQSRGIDKQEFECELYGNYNNLPSNDVDVVKPPTTDPEKPFIWQTKFLKSHDIWFLIAFKICSSVHFRPGLTSDVLKNELGTVLTEEEIRSALNALIDGGALKYSRMGALVSGSDWWRRL